MKNTLALLISLSSVLLCNAQIVVNPNATTDEIKQLLAGPGIIIFNLTVNCGDSASGLIDAAFNPIFYGQGFAITNGRLDNITGPNNMGSLGYDSSLPGDTDLNNITGVSTFDACIVEFDLITSADTFLFYYFFGSEEYPEFVGAGVNDGFGVFVSGPGITGSFSNNAENFATVPGTGNYVSIDAINNGSNDCAFGGPAGPCVNCAYYINNCNGTTFQYDGFTKMLEGKVPVTESQTYHIKLAVADGGDGVWDSGVFFPKGAFRTTKLSFVGIEDHEQGNTFSIYPNPASTQLTVEFNTEHRTPNNECRIYNTLGQQVFPPFTRPSSSVPFQTTIDISAYPAGIYYLYLQTDEEIAVKKFEVIKP